MENLFFLIPIIFISFFFGFSVYFHQNIIASQKVIISVYGETLKIQKELTDWIKSALIAYRDGYDKLSFINNSYIRERDLFVSWVSGLPIDYQIQYNDMLARSRETKEYKEWLENAGKLPDKNMTDKDIKNGQ